MIVAKPFGGLCNRLRLIDSARTLAKRVGTDVCVIWKPAADMVATFDQLFEQPPDLRFRSDGRFRYVQSPSAWGYGSAPLISLANRLLGVDRAYFERDMPRIWNGDIELTALRASETVLLCTCQSLTTAATLDFSWLRPSGPLSERIDAERRRLGDQLPIGVHIRRTDHAVSIRESPLELFVERMTDEQRRDPAVRFFLATDDAETERVLRERFGPAVQTYHKRFGRSSVDAIRDAVVDLFLLSATRELFASSGSSFSETAAVIGRVPLTILRRQP